jgi:acid phosphatase family membrane protein YuiD
MAQSIKFVTMLIKQHRVDFRLFASTGGMPSAHSSMVCGLATATGLEAGFGSPLFAAAAVFASIVMFDAQSVRRAAGQQAKVLNLIVDELFTHHRISENRLAELLGHTRLQVFAGAALGIATALGLHWIFVWS